MQTHHNVMTASQWRKVLFVKSRQLFDGQKRQINLHILLPDNRQLRGIVLIGRQK
mgnify:FL=1